MKNKFIFIFVYTSFVFFSNMLNYYFINIIFGPNVAVWYS